MSLTIQLALQQATQVLSKAHFESARLEAELLLAHVLNQSRTHLFTWSDKLLTTEQITRFNQLVQERLVGKPIAYIIGKREFWTLDLVVTPDTLIPRPETELLVELALELIPKNEPYSILDLGTGTGAIALAIASERPQALITAVDQSSSALAIATVNATKNQIKNANFIQSNWFNTLSTLAPKPQFNLIVSNPPYLADQDQHLQHGDVRFEPLSALASGLEGLDDLKIIITQAYKYLLHKGYLMVEHGYNQGEAVRSLFKQARFLEVETKQDLAGNDRVTLGHY